MKLIATIILVFLMGIAVMAFPGEDSTQSKKEEKIEIKVDNKTESTYKNLNKKKDVFIDKDGDGICDNRANGMSFEKFRKRYQHRKAGQVNQGGKKW